MGSYPMVEHRIDVMQQDITNMCDILLGIDHVSAGTEAVQEGIENRLEVAEEKIVSLLTQNNEITEELNELKDRYDSVVTCLNSAVKRINDIHRWLVFKFESEKRDKAGELQSFEQALKCYETINFDDLSDFDENEQ